MQTFVHIDSPRTHAAASPLSDRLPAVDKTRNMEHSGTSRNMKKKSIFI